MGTKQPMEVKQFMGVKQPRDAKQCMDTKQRMDARHMDAEILQEAYFNYHPVSIRHDVNSKTKEKKYSVVVSSGTAEHSAEWFKKNLLKLMRR